MRRYEQRRDGKGLRHQLAEDIKQASLEALLPEDLEKHVQMNRAWLANYEELRLEIITYLFGVSTRRQFQSNETLAHREGADRWAHGRRRIA